ncbi:MAG: diguanylate cyclase [Planctomycetota bacterium]
MNSPTQPSQNPSIGSGFTFSGGGSEGAPTDQTSGAELLAKLRPASAGSASQPADHSKSGLTSQTENQLAMVRLGIATSLFFALRTKHNATAAHGLRVALVCSSWAEQMQLDEDVRNRIEVAALLHDIGKIGIPDRILRKPGKLTVEEQLAMDTCQEVGCEILRGCTTDTELLDIVRYSGVWYDSRRGGEAPREQALPLGSRMLAIADAFDSMTTRQDYRPARSVERAVAELVRASGSQFDPDMVADFGRLLASFPEIAQGTPHPTTLHRWLHQLRPQDVRQPWKHDEGSASGGAGGTAIPCDPIGSKGVDQLALGQRAIPGMGVVRSETRFNHQLLRSLKDGVIFTDAEGTIREWNLAMQRLTDLPADVMIGKHWSTTAMQMRDADRNLDQPTTCPLEECIKSNVAVQRTMVIESTRIGSISVHVEVAPVMDAAKGFLGTVIVIHDLSDRKQLEQRLKTLHKQSCLDPLTGTANRAHFDKNLAELVASTVKGGPTFSLLICDLDHFKRINDTYGHPAGDEALKVFANLLTTHSRDGDLVARYGGEEFLLLASSCDNATGAQRAEEIRKALEVTPIESLEGECITASFGVTEFQSGDDASTVLARADRALLKAKDNGRNRVIQLGLGKMSEVAEATPRASWFDWLTGADLAANTTVDILTPVPIDLAIEKLRGFIADHKAEIIHVEENQLSLKVNSGAAPGGRRRIDHRISFQATLTLSSAHPDELQNEKASQGNHTKVHLELKPQRNRDRRRREMKQAVAQLVSSFRCYLMGEVI